MYQALLFAPDGDWVTDYKANTVEDVWERVNDGGSRWFFYPLVFVVKDWGNHYRLSRARIIDAPDFPILRELKGRATTTAAKVIQENAQLLCDLLNG